LTEVSCQPHTPAAFLPGKETLYLLNKKLRGPPMPVGAEKNLFPLPGFKPHILQPIAQAL